MSQRKWFSISSPKSSRVHSFLGHKQPADLSRCTCFLEQAPSSHYSAVGYIMDCVMFLNKFFLRLFGKPDS